MHALSVDGDASRSLRAKPDPCRAPARPRSQASTPAGGHELQRVAGRRAVLGERRCACGGLMGPTGECAACRARRQAAQAPAPAPAAAEVELDVLDGDDERLPADEPAGDAPAPAGPAQDEEHPGVLWDSVNGQTGCTLPGGTAFTTTLTTKCYVGCTAQHEATHVADIKPCCAKAGAAHAQAADADAKTAVEDAWAAWLKLKANEDWLESRAYERSVSCADKALAAKKCWKDGMAPGDRECCKDTTHYRRSSEQLRQIASANAPAALTSCPFT